MKREARRGRLKEAEERQVDRESGSGEMERDGKRDRQRRKIKKEGERETGEKRRERCIG